MCSLQIPSASRTCPGAKGNSHGVDYIIEDPELACVESAVWQLSLLHVLLSAGGERAKEIIAQSKPEFASKKEYFEYLDSFACEGDRITYTDDTASVKL